MTTGLGALRDDDVDALLDLLLRVASGADERADEDAVLVREVDDRLRRRAERVDEEPDQRVLERHVDGAGGLVVDAEARSARVVVPDYQLSLAIGKEGQNARLAARLTGWRIDIRSDEETPGAP